MVAAGFERHVGRCAARFLARLPQRHGFGMRFAGPGMEPLADDPAPIDDDATDRWIGGATAQALHGQAQGAAHETDIFLGDVAHFFLRRVFFNNGSWFSFRRLRSCSSCSIWRRNASTSWKLWYTEAKRT